MFFYKYNNFWSIDNNNLNPKKYSDTEKSKDDYNNENLS